MNQVTARYLLDGIDGTTWRQTTVLRCKLLCAEPVLLLESGSDPDFLWNGSPRHETSHDDDENQDRGQHESEADRAREEDSGIAAREKHRAAQVLFHEGAEDEAEKKRRGLALELGEDVAQH